MRVECISDSELFFSAIHAFVDEWFVEAWSLDDGKSPHSIRSPWPDRKVTFTASDELTLPMMRWILTKSGDLHVAAQTLQRFEEYTGDRVHYDEVVVQEPSPVVWHLVQRGLENASEFLANRVAAFNRAARDLAVPASVTTTDRLRSKDKYVDLFLKSHFVELHERSRRPGNISKSPQSKLHKEAEKK